MNSSLDAVGGAETATERLQLELEQLRSELDSCSTRLHLTEKLLAHVQDAVFVAELDGRIIDVNPAACSLLGYERQELLKIRPWDFATSASWEGILALIGTMELGDPVTVQRAYRCKSGEQKILDVRLTRENHAGRDLIVVFSRDVTEQKRLELRSRQNGRKLTESQRFANPGTTAMDVTEGTKIEEALKRSQEYLRLTIDTIPTFAWCNRPDGSNEFLNQRWLDYTVFRSRRRGIGGGRLPFTLKISRDYYMYGRRCWHRASLGNWKLGCGASMGCIVGSCSVSNRYSTRRETSLSGMERTPTSTTASGPKRCWLQRRRFSN